MEKTLLGLFRGELDKLAQNLYIFSFNGSSYDHCALANYILSSDGKYGGQYHRNWKISKRGSSVPTIDLPSKGLHFRGEDNRMKY